ncbi:serine/threonine-protein phosphatase 7 long form homolog [Arachis stenosperma]|uniref:serine/threonine-protein phosphatase 7 long form homolog n=1 Tax=Arachis stenosperma TaxID=217475 RepID=UPI0025AC62E4|nr:serine/threonine-protein phosphatase 7 long form homolog [Arachis stenosperma]
MLTSDHPVPPDRYDERVEDHLRVTGFYHASQIGIVQNQKALVNALVERCHPDTHTFHLPVGECAVTLEDVALILGLPTDGLPVTRMTISSFDALEAECLNQFGVAPRKSECRGSCIKLTWLRDLRERLQLVDEISIQRYVKCHIILLIGMILFGDKSGASVHFVIAFKLFFTITTVIFSYNIPVGLRLFEFHIQLNERDSGTTFKIH